MKNLTKNDVQRRFENSNWSPETKITNLNRPYKFKNLIFNKILTIVIPGHPIIDSRPRFLQKKDGTVGTYNPHKAQLMKVFKEIYENSDILQGICILGPMFVELEIYELIPKTYLKELDKKSLEDLENNNLPAFNKPDVDNGMKITYDVSQDLEYQVILRDEHVVDSRTYKVYVKDKRDERMVMNIYFNDDIPKWYRNILYESRDYLVHNLSMKYKFINQIPDEEWEKTFYKVIVNYIKRTKKNPVKAVNLVLSKYKKKDLDLILVEKNADLAKEKILNIVEAIYIKVKAGC